MKINAVICHLCFLLLAVMLFSGCKGNTYSKLLKKENKLIDDFIDREGIRVFDEWPKTWGEKDYYSVPGTENMYIHIIEQDTSNTEISTGCIVWMRYKKYGLKNGSDTIRYWTTDDGAEPIRFQYQNPADQFYCAGWNKAVELMKYSGSHCRIICPSKMGFSEDLNSVTPYGYELKFKVQP